MKDLFSLGMNVVIGTGIFFLPRNLAENMGPAGILCVLSAASVCFLILACFASAGARFTRTGGAYLYAKQAFGDFIGFEVGWMSWLTRVLAWGALAHAFSTSLIGLFGGIDSGLLHNFLACGVVVLLSAANCFSTKLSTHLLNGFFHLKLLTLLSYVGVGIFFIRWDYFRPFAPYGHESFGETTALFLFAFAGFESLAVPAGEARNPQSTVPMALFAVIIACTLIYTSVVFVTFGTLEDPASSQVPVAAAAQSFAGSFGGISISIGITVSVFGVNAAVGFTAPRALYALSEQGQLPHWISSLHSTRKTPWVAVMVSALATIAFTLVGTFEGLAMVSVIGRFLQYIPTCASVLLFRYRCQSDDSTPAFKLPLGPFFPLAGILSCAWLISETKFDKILPCIAALLLGGLIHFTYRKVRACGQN